MPTLRQPPRSCSPVRRNNRSIPSAGKISSTGKLGGTMCVTGLKTGASFGFAGNNGRIQIIRHIMPRYTSVARVAGQLVRPARLTVMRRKGKISRSKLHGGFAPC